MPGLKLFQSNQMEVLAQALADLLRTPPLHPLESEIIVVQSKGMERWLSLELARRLGISANIRFLFPDRFITELFQGILPNVSPDDPSCDPDIISWEIMRILGTLLDINEFEVLKRYLKGSDSEIKLFQLSRRIAETFDHYLLFRPEMILRWEKGMEDHWQARLWRVLIKDKEKKHIVALRHHFMDAMQNPHEKPEMLPERVSIFGISTLPLFHIETFAAIAGDADVNLFLMNPCREFWEDIFSEREMMRVKSRQKQTGLTPADLYLEGGNSLLSSMGIQGRDFFKMVNRLQVEEIPLFADSGEETLLGAIQSDILNLRDRGKDGKMAVRSGDETIRIHSCHSPMREIEALQDNLLALFDQHPDLKPADILVMTPDITLYAPFIQAVFSLPRDHPHFIPFSIADRGLRQESPLIDGFLNLLNLSGSRFGASQVFDILQSPSVRTRFSLSENDLELVHEWIQKSGIRWGMDAQHRESLGLPAISRNTWQEGLDRMLLGYALPSADREPLFKGILPYGDIEGSDTDILENFLTFTKRLFDSMRSLDHARTPKEWAGELTGLLETFFSIDAEEHLPEAQALRQLFNKLTGIQTSAGFTEKVGFDLIKAWLAENLEKKGFGFGFLTGGMTFCAMLPMRSIPFSSICMIGMGDSAYPRHSSLLGFDLIAKKPKAGDPSRRNDDRYLFLEAILSARQNLYISYTGQSIKDNSLRPPSVLVSELLDYIEQGFETSDPEEKIRERIITKHPLQAFNSAYFGPGEKIFSYSEDNLQTARIAHLERRAPSGFISSSLSEPEEEWKMVNLDSLCSFFGNPAKYLLNKRLGLYLEEESAILDEMEPFSVEGLEKYNMQLDLTAKGLEGQNLADLYSSALASGLLPHGVPGEYAYDRLCKFTEDFISRLIPFVKGGRLEPLEVDLAIGSYYLTGRIDNIYEQGSIHYRPAKIKARDSLKAWIYHLVINHAGCGKYPNSSLLFFDDQTLRYLPVDRSEQYLDALLGLYWQGLRKPLKFFPESSWEYANQIEKGSETSRAMQSARGKWDGFLFPERENPYYRLCFGDDSLDNEFQQRAIEIIGPILKHYDKSQ
jgi:exodeoxyribonuclease V gamma subunit